MNVNRLYLTKTMNLISNHRNTYLSNIFIQIANIGPADYNSDETLNTLRYANGAKQIQNKAHINEDPKDAMLREFQKEIERLRKNLEEDEFSEDDESEEEDHKNGKKRRKKKVKGIYMYICVHTYIHTYIVIHTYVHTYIHTYNIRICTMYIYTCTDVCTCIYTSSFIGSLSRTMPPKAMAELRAQIEKERVELRASKNMAEGERDKAQNELEMKEKELKKAQ